MGYIRQLIDAVVDFCQSCDLDELAIAAVLGLLSILVAIRLCSSKKNCKAQHSSESHLDAEDEDHPTAGPAEEEKEWIDLNFQRYSEATMKTRAAQFYALHNKRRTIRTFSSSPLPDSVLDNIIKAAGTAPSGANTQPWTFAVIKSQDYKHKIREIVESEERINYERRMGDKWVQDLEKFKTDWAKPYLENAPALIVVFRSPYSIGEDGEKRVHYYHELSTGIACGMLVAAIHNAGLATVTSTPLNAGGRIRQLLQRPAHEKVVLLLPVGYPEDGCQVPNIERKPLNEIMVEF